MMVVAVLTLAAPGVTRRRNHLDHRGRNPVQQKLLHEKLVIPVKPGHLTLYCPKWIQVDMVPIVHEK
jgi:hypothetical protein